MTLVTAYTNPGVTVTEATSPGAASILSTPNAIAIIGTARGTQQATDRAILSGVTDFTLSKTGVTASSAVVVNVTQNTTVDAGNYRVYQTLDPNSSVTGDEVYAIHRVPTPSSAVTVVTSGSGVLTGTYVYAASFVTPSGVTGETAIGTVSSQVVPVAQKIYVSAVPLGPSGTTARNIYRAIVTGSTIGTYHLVTTLADNTTTIYLDNNSDATVAAAATAKNGIATGDTVTVTYSYADVNYYDPTYFTNFADVSAKYGEPFASDGTINCQLSFAIRMAFQNGASEVIGVAINGSDLAGACAQLLDIEQIAFVSVASGSHSDHVIVQSHCASAASTYGLYRQCVVGEDSSAASITTTALRTDAQTFNDANVILVSPSSFNILNPVSLKPYAVGAQYVAAGILGMFAARDATVPLTRKNVAGLLSPNETRTTSEAAADSSAGLCVVEYKGSGFRIRHGCTTAIGSVNTAEASVVRAKYVLAYELKHGLDSLIGLVAPVEEAPGIVASRANSILGQLVSGGIIGSYQNLSTRLLDSPTTVEVRFEYTPLYPLNNINVVFTINTQTGGFALTQG